ncbi:hypothetical protein AB0F36_35460 [Streptomyces sp. NPDC029080]|uniref:hypothetical protein n=1 Tax=Streptomyces sp. NPDC029080 TaxID=3155017 RepID=UPI0033ECCE12
MVIRSAASPGSGSSATGPACSSWSAPAATTAPKAWKRPGLLLALDFAGDLVDVISQPMRRRFSTADKRRSHTPDFLAVTRRGGWLIDVRPEPLIEEKDLESFDASAEVALACGWHYTVAARWGDHICSTLDALLSAYSPMCRGRYG